MDRRKELKNLAPVLLLQLKISELTEGFESDRRAKPYLSDLGLFSSLNKASTFSSLSLLTELTAGTGSESAQMISFLRSRELGQIIIWAWLGQKRFIGQRTFSALYRGPVLKMLQLQDFFCKISILRDIIANLVLVKSLNSQSISIGSLFPFLKPHKILWDPLSHAHIYFFLFSLQTVGPITHFQ